MAKEVEGKGGGGGMRGEGQRKEGVRGSERGTDSVPTLLITVSLETERGLPLALGNSLGPVAAREQRRREGRGQRRGKEGRKGGILKGARHRNSLHRPFFWFYLIAFTLEVNFFTASPLPSSA